MNDRKPGDSPSDYCREVYPRRVLETLTHQEREVRRLALERAERRMQALLPSAEPVYTDEFGTRCTL